MAFHEGGVAAGEERDRRGDLPGLREPADRDVHQAARGSGLGVVMEKGSRDVRAATAATLPWEVRSEVPQAPAADPAVDPLSCGERGT